MPLSPATGETIATTAHPPIRVSSAAYLLNLPLEILQLILGEFCQHCRGAHLDCAPDVRIVDGVGTRKRDPDALGRYGTDRRTLLAVMLTARALRGVAEAVLHHFVAAARYDHAAISRHLDLPATHVRMAYLQDGFIGSGKPPYELIGCSLFGSLIAHLVNLQYLSLRDIAGSLHEVPYALQKVESLSLLTLDVSFFAVKFIIPYSLGKLSGMARRIMHLSANLETLNIHSCYSTDRHVFSLPKLQTLRITESLLSVADLKGLLDGCTGLRSFTYEDAGPDTPFIHGYKAERALSPSDAVRALDPFRGTLESLHVTKRPWGARLANEKGPLPSLDRFTALRDLLVDWSSVCDVDSNRAEVSSVLAVLLPPNLESLRLVMCAPFGQLLDPLESALWGLATSPQGGGRRKPFPHLKYVGCDIDIGARGERLRDVYRNLGIDLDYSVVWGGGSDPGEPSPTGPPMLLSNFYSHLDL